MSSLRALIHVYCKCCRTLTLALARISCYWQWRVSICKLLLVILWILPSIPISFRDICANLFASSTSGSIMKTSCLLGFLPIFNDVYSPYSVPQLVWHSDRPTLLRPLIPSVERFGAMLHI